MAVGFDGTRKGKAGAFLYSVVAAAAVLLIGGQGDRAALREASQAALRRPTGQPQLVAVTPLPAMEASATEGQMCQLFPASASFEMLLQQGRSGDGASAPGRTFENADRAPVRIIRDTYPTYSAVALNLQTDEVFLQDENLFGIKVFNRLDNTPPNASFTEPKRAIAGGAKTKLEFNCGLYVDPKSGDIYSITNDTVNTMTVFPWNASGELAPKRELTAPHGTFGIAVDETVQELYLTVQHDNSVVVFHKMAAGDDKPIRTLEGDNTQLEDPHGVAVDPKNGWMFISNHGHAVDNPRKTGKFEPPSITVYPLKASGDTAPLRIIEGPRTRLNWPAALWVDVERGELYVANDADDSVLVFRTGDNGDAPPARVIKGPKTGVKNPTGIYLDDQHGELWVSNMGNHSTTVFPRAASGDVAPLRTIRSAPLGKRALAIGNPGAVAYDSKREEVLVPN